MDNINPCSEIPTPELAYRDKVEDFGMTYDIKTGVFIDENSGFILDATYVMLEDTEKIQEKIQKNCGVEVDDFFIEILRNTVETMVPAFPFGN